MLKTCMSWRFPRHLSVKSMSVFVLVTRKRPVIKMHLVLNRKNDLSLKRVTQDFWHIIDVEPAIKAATEKDRKPPLEIFLFFFFFGRISQAIVSGALQ